MRKTRLLGFALIVLLVIAGTARAERPVPKNFVAHLSGDEENPPVETMATGQTTFHLRDDSGELRYMLIVANIADVTQAHIHCGAIGVNGPVVAFLFGLVSEGVTVNGVLSEGTITNADVIPRSDSEACPGGVANFDDLIDKMQNGDAYVNVHTLANPGGEIRGQILSAGPPFSDAR